MRFFLKKQLIKFSCTSLALIPMYLLALFIVQNFKSGIFTFQKLFLLFTSMTALQKMPMMKNAFYFILKSLFVLKIFKFLS